MSHLRESNNSQSERPGRIFITFLLSTAVVLSFSLSSCSKKQPKEKQAPATDSVHHNPNVDIEVNKLYDEKGNLLAFDSLYRSFYSDTLMKKRHLDTLFNSFRHSYLDKTPTLMDQHFNRLFFRDSLIHSDFFHEDFFRKRYEKNDAYMRRMMHELDSIKNKHYKELSERHKIISKKP